MKKIGIYLIGLLVLSFIISCNVQDYNLRVIHDIDREYVSIDSTTYHMNWKSQAWRDKNVKYFSSAGVIITNPYNVFKHPEWIRYIVDGNGANNFEGAILVEYDPQYINIDWMSQPTGTFEGDIFDHFVQSNNTYLLRDENNEIVFVDPNYIIKPSAFANSTFKLELTDIFTTYFDTLHVYLGEPAHVTYGYCFPDYNWQDYGPISVLTPTLVDPFELGKTYDQYTLAEKSANFHPYQNNIVDTMNNAGCLIIRGDRFEHETPSASLLATKDINGVFFEDVDFSSMLSVIDKATSYRTAFTPATENQSLLLVAGIKTDLYHTPSLYNQARLFQSMLNGGIYFTPGYDGTKYENFPDQQLADWWLRSSDDKNWGAHHMNPTYVSIAATPRKVTDRTVYNTVLNLGHPAYVHWHYQDFSADATIDYDTAALNDATVINTHAFREYDPQYPETAWIDYVDNVREINPDFVNIIYTSVHPRIEWASWSNESLPGRLWNTMDRIDQRMINEQGKPYGAWLRDIEGNIVLNYSEVTRIINPYAVYDGIADSLAAVIVDELDGLTNDREYTGIFIDWLDNGYPNWACAGDNCYMGVGTIGIDMDGDTIPYKDTSGLNPDTDESIGYALFCQSYLEALRNEFAERGMANRLIVTNGTYVRYNQAGADLVEGMMWEGFNIYTPGTASESNWDFAINDVANMFTNSLLNPPFIAFQATAYDTSTGRFVAPIAMAGNGWANVHEASDMVGQTTMFGLSERLPAAGALVSKEYIDVGNPATTLDDTIHTVFENYETYSVIKVDAITPWPYLAISGTDTLSVGGGWRLVVDETDPTLSGVDAICAAGGDQQSVYAFASEPIYFKTRYGSGSQLNKIVLGSWSAYSGTLTSTVNYIVSVISLPANYFWKVEIMAKDAVGNESIVYSDYFQVTVSGDCP